MRTRRVFYFRGSMKFTKPPLTVDQQIALLNKRGMVIDDLAAARNALHALNYYRLSAYWLPFESPPSGSAARSHQFVSGTTFKHCLDLYAFDDNLRRLCFDGITALEICIRSQFAAQLSLAYGSHFYLEPRLFKSTLRSSMGQVFWDHSSAVADIRKSVMNSREIFIKHYLANYDDPKDYPPIWMVSEIMSFGELSRWIKNLNAPKDRQKIADFFDLDESVFDTAIHHFSVLRNICAHHSRLWNRDLVFPLKLPQRPAFFRSGYFNTGIHSRRIYNSLVMLAYFIGKIIDAKPWMHELAEHIKTCPCAFEEMGYEKDWEKRRPWN